MGTTRHDLTLDHLAAAGGRLLQDGDPGWDDAVRLWNGMVTRTPTLVLQPRSAAEVAAGVGFARDHGLALGVKGGGHHIAGTAIADGGLLLDLSGMRELTVDPGAALAHVGPGCRLADVDRATQAHGLATPLGFISEVGVGGLTLGGGLGYLTRRFGWTVDNLVEAEVVGADGQVRTALTPRARPWSSVPTARSARPAAPATRTCSGDCGAAAATWGWSPGSASSSTRWAPRSTGR
jgi:hypothetical protein